MHLSTYTNAFTHTHTHTHMRSCAQPNTRECLHVLSPTPRPVELNLRIWTKPGLLGSLRALSLPPPSVLRTTVHPVELSVCVQVPSSERCGGSPSPVCVRDRGREGEGEREREGGRGREGEGGRESMRHAVYQDPKRPRSQSLFQTPGPHPEPTTHLASLPTYPPNSPAITSRPPTPTPAPVRS
jgi:hypothetical protein